MISNLSEIRSSFVFSFDLKFWFCILLVSCVSYIVFFALSMIIYKISLQWSTFWFDLNRLFMVQILPLSHFYFVLNLFLFSNFLKYISSWYFPWHLYILTEMQSSSFYWIHFRLCQFLFNFFCIQIILYWLFLNPEIFLLLLWFWCDFASLFEIKCKTTSFAAFYHPFQYSLKVILWFCDKNNQENASFYFI